MKKQGHKKTKGESDVTLMDFFKMVDEVAKKAKTDPSSQKLIDSAAQKWQSDSKYAIWSHHIVGYLNSCWYFCCEQKGRPCRGAKEAFAVCRAQACFSDINQMHDQSSHSSVLWTHGDE